MSVIASPVDELGACGMSPKGVQEMSSTRRILMVVANPSVSTTTGWPVGFWAAELIHPYDAFTRNGYQVTIASPNGGKVELDAYSDPRDPVAIRKTIR
jgi:putative intracellular protease/amidase